MIWADRLGVCLLVLWLLWGALANAHARETLGIVFLIFFVLAPWLFCRMCDFLATGRIVVTKSGGPWRHDQRVNLRVGAVVAALAAIVYWTPFGAVQGVALFSLIIFGYWLISSAGHSSALSRGEIIEPANRIRKDQNLAQAKAPPP